MSVFGKLLRFIGRVLVALLPFTRRGFRRWRRATVFCLALLGLFWLIELLLFPWLVKRIVADQLSDLGFPDAHFEINRITTDRAELSQVHGDDPDEPTIESAIIRFSPLKIIHGQLGEIDLSGAKVVLDPRRGTDNLGHRHHEHHNRKKGDDGLPFDRIVVSSSSIVVRTDKGEYWLPTSATLEHSGFDLLDLDVQSQLNGSNVDVKGRFDGQSHIHDVTLDAPAIGLDWVIDLVHLRLDVPFRGGGLAKLSAHFHEDHDVDSYHFSFDPHDAWIDGKFFDHAISFDRADIRLSADFDDRFHLAGALAEANLPRASFDHQAIHDVQFSATPVDARTFALSMVAQAHLADSLHGTGILRQVDLTNLADLVLTANSKLVIQPGKTLKETAVSLQDTAARLSLPASAITFSDGTIVLANVSADIPMRADVNGRNISVRVLPGAAASLGSLQIDGCKVAPSSASDPLMTATLDSSSAIDLRPDDADHRWVTDIGVAARVQPFDFSGVGLTINAIEAGVKIGLKADSTGAVAALRPDTNVKWSGLSASGISISGGEINFTGSASRHRGQKPVLDTDIHLAKTSAQIDAINCRLGAIAADIPIRWNVPDRAPDPAPRFSVQSVDISSTRLPRMDGALSLVDGQVGFSLSWPVLKDAVVQGQIALGLNDLGTADMKLQIPEFQLKEGDAIATIIPALKGISLTGLFSADADVKYQSGRLTPHATVSVHSMRVETGKDQSFVLDDVDAHMVFDNFSPLSTPGNQQLFIHTAQIGKMKLENGEIQFRVESPDSIYVEHTGWDYVGGRMHANSFRFNPSTPVIDFTVDVQGLELKEVLESFLPGEASGEGLLYGRIPIRLRWPHVFFGRGYLYSAPGPGEIMAGKAADRVGQMLDASDPRFATDETFKQLKARALDAIRDFQYDMIKMNWQDGPDGLVGTINLAGKGKGNDGQALNLNLTINGMDKALTRYLMLEKTPSGD